MHNKAKVVMAKARQERDNRRKIEEIVDWKDSQRIYKVLDR